MGKKTKLIKKIYKVAKGANNAADAMRKLGKIERLIEKYFQEKEDGSGVSHTATERMGLD